MLGEFDRGVKRTDEAIPDDAGQGDRAAGEAGVIGAERENPAEAGWGDFGWGLEPTLKWPA